MENPNEGVPQSEGTDPPASSNGTETNSSTSAANPSTSSKTKLEDVQLFQKLMGLLDTDKSPWTLDPSLTSVADELRFVAEIQYGIARGTVSFEGEEHSDVLRELLNVLTRELAVELNSLSGAVQRLSRYFTSKKRLSKLK